MRLYTISGWPISQTLCSVCLFHLNSWICHQLRNQKCYDELRITGICLWIILIPSLNPARSLLVLQRETRAEQYRYEQFVARGFLKVRWCRRHAKNTIQWRACFHKNILSLPIVPDLAILCTNATPQCRHLLKSWPRKGLRRWLCFLLTCTSTADNGETFFWLKMPSFIVVAKKHNIRVLGPNVSWWIIVPLAQFERPPAFLQWRQLPGKIAFVSRRPAAVCTTILFDWANDKEIGFSAFGPDR